MDGNEVGALDLNLRRLERAAIETAMLQTKGNRSKAADLLGINIRTLRRKLNDRFKVGERVLVHELDVFGKISELVPLTVICEPPMPGYVWTGKASGLSR